jgi:hypothetical protein
MFLSKGGDSGELNPVPFLLGAAAVVILVVAGFVIYNQFIAPKQKKEEKIPPAPKPAGKVSVTSEPPKEKRAPVFKPSSISDDSEVIKEADNALASILGEDISKKEPEKVEVVEATVVE